mmetsp:Transcript_81205/g.218373  ORF Transcript_81205/g.218373 Transcript_81205/m.218373 type:complete len:102 (-) Transcript_81205:889-1194(-)
MNILIKVMKISKRVGFGFQIFSGMRDITAKGKNCFLALCSNMRARKLGQTNFLVWHTSGGGLNKPGMEGTNGLFGALSWLLWNLSRFGGHYLDWTIDGSLH